MEASHFLISKHITKLLSLSVWSAVTKSHRLGVLNNRNLYLTVLEIKKSQIKVSANSVPGESLVVGRWQPPPCMLTRPPLCIHVERKTSAVSSYKNNSCCSETSGASWVKSETGSIHVGQGERAEKGRLLQIGKW